jgi:hypothetical protein
MAESAQLWEKPKNGQDVRPDAGSTGAMSGAVLAREGRRDSLLDLGSGQGARAQQSGLLLPRRLSFETWRQIGSQIVSAVNSCAWWVGDWLVYGENSYGDRYGQAIADTSLDYKTLRNYSWVAKKFPMSRRRDSLSFGHHAEVAALTEAEQDKWLTQAERFTWSRNELRRQIHAIRLTNQAESLDLGATQAKTLKIEAAAKHLDSWQRAADRTNLGITEWIIVSLNRAASTELQAEGVVVPAKPK